VLTAARTLAFAAGLPRAHPGCWIAGAGCAAGHAIPSLALEPPKLGTRNAAPPATIFPPASDSGRDARQVGEPEGSYLRDSDGCHDFTLEPAETAHPRRINGQPRSFDLVCEGSGRS
jgi:hypothetical protein